MSVFLTPGQLSWLEPVPEHWQVRKLRQLLTPFSERNRPDLPLLSVVREKGVIVRDVADKEENHNYVPDDLSNYKVVRRGQFVINKMKAWQGSYGISRFDGIVSPAYFVFAFRQDVNPEFFHQAIRARTYVQYFAQASDGIRTGQWDLSMQRMKEIPFLLPPREEQDRIVRFLNWKVSCINHLAAGYRRRLDLLEEMKRTFIDRAVIQGLRQAPLAATGDARWEISYPAHWKVQRVREVFTFRKGLSITKANLKESGIPVVSYGQIHARENSGTGLHQGLIRYVDESYLDSNPSALVEPGDFIFADTSEDLAGCGSCAYTDWEGPVFAGYHTIIAHPNEDIRGLYTAYLFRSPSWRSQIQRKANGVKVYSITQKMLKDALILQPPQEEQTEMVAYLNRACSRIDALAEKTRKKIAALQDLKVRLTAEAVTGGIDVCGIEIPDWEPEPAGDEETEP